jgi:SET domain-containing protein
MSEPVNRHQPAAVYVADSDIHGKGLFAAQAFQSGAYIGFYEGAETMENGTYVLWVQESASPESEELWLGYDGNNELRFLNHAKDPSCEMDGQALYALRDIDKGEELTFDYGEWFEES